MNISSDKFYLVNISKQSPSDFLTAGFIKMAQTKSIKEASCFLVLSECTPNEEYTFYILKKDALATEKDALVFIPKYYFHIDNWKGKFELHERYDPWFNNGADSIVIYGYLGDIKRIF